MERNDKLQKQYVERHGLVGLREPKFKREKKRRYLLHKKLKEIGIRVSSRKRLIPSSVDIENLMVKELVNEYGYTLQHEIE